MSTSTFSRENIKNCQSVKLQSGVFAGIEDVSNEVCSYEGWQPSKNNNVIATLRTDKGGVIRCMGARLIQEVERLGMPAIAEIVDDELIFHSKFLLSSSNNKLVISPIQEKKELTDAEKLALFEKQMAQKP